MNTGVIFFFNIDPVTCLYMLKGYLYLQNFFSVMHCSKNKSEKICGNVILDSKFCQHFRI